MILSEKLAFVDTAQGSYVIRARPSEAVEKIHPANGAPFLALWEVLRDAVRRGPWTVMVRKSDDDPYGPVVSKESFPSKKLALDAFQRVRTELAARDLPGSA